MHSPHTVLRAPVGDESLAEMLGSNTSAGVHALSTSLTKRPWPKVSTFQEFDSLNECHCPTEHR
jgi:hypothetical protein